MDEVPWVRLLLIQRPVSLRGKFCASPPRTPHIRWWDTDRTTTINSPFAKRQDKWHMVITPQDWNPAGHIAGKTFSGGREHSFIQASPSPWEWCPSSGAGRLHNLWAKYGPWPLSRFLCSLSTRNFTFLRVFQNKIQTATRKQRRICGRDYIWPTKPKTFTI